MARSRRRKFPDVVEEGVVSELSPEGHGWVDTEKRRVLLPGVLPGERVEFKRVQRRGPFDMAELESTSGDGVGRVSPRCPHFGDCGGCTLQHLDHPGQLAHAQSTLASLFEAAGCPEGWTWLDALYCGDEDGTWNYRRRARLGVRWVEKKGRVLVGFRERRDARFVADMGECHVLESRAAVTLDELSPLIAGMDARSEIPQIEVALGDDAAIFVFRVLRELAAGDVQILIDFGKRRGIAVYVQYGGLDTVEPISDEFAPVHVDGPLTQALPEFGVDFRFGPTDFVQVNARMNRAMVARVLELLDPGPEDEVLDLFCGLGNFTLPLARRARKVWGVEGDATLVARAQANAQRHGLANVEFLQRNLYVEAQSEDRPWGRAGAQVDLILLDPPRSGAGLMLEELAGLAARRIVYVACGPKNLATDVARLGDEFGYVMSSAGIIDMFPHTGHFESVVVLDRARAGAAVAG